MLWNLRIDPGILNWGRHHGLISMGLQEGLSPRAVTIRVLHALIATRI